MPFNAVGSVISAGIGLIGSGMQADAIKSGAQKAAMTQLYQQNLLRGDLGGYMTAGRNATDFLLPASGATGQDNPLFDQNTVLRMSGVLGPQAEAASPVQNVAGQLSGIYGPEAAQTAMGDFRESPGYQYRVQQGLDAVDHAAAARGILRSGATLQAEQTLGDNLASQEYQNYVTNAGTQYGNYFSRAGDAFGNYYNRLFDLAKIGENAAANVGAQGQASANAQSNIATGAAGAEARNIGNLTQGLQTATNGLFSSQGVKDWAGGLFGPSSAPLNTSPGEAGATPMPTFGGFGGYQTAPGLSVGGYYT